MASNIIEEYLVRLGFDIAAPELAKFKSGMTEAHASVTSHTAGIAKDMLEWQAAVTGAFTAVGIGVIGLADHVANTDQSYRLLGLQMFMTQDRARTLKIATDALGESMEAIAWDPELHQRFVQLQDDQQRMAASLGMGTNYEAQLEKIRDIRFEFTRLHVEAEYLSFGFISQLFTQMGGGPDAVQHKLQQLNDWIQGNIPGMAKYLAGHMIPVLKDWKQIMADTGGLLEDMGLAFTNLIGALSGDQSLQGTTFSFEKMSEAVGKLAHWLGEGVEAAILAERALLHFGESAVFSLEAVWDAAHLRMNKAKADFALSQQEMAAFAKDITPGSGSILGVGVGSAGGAFAGGMAGGAVGGPLGMLLGAGLGSVTGGAITGLTGHSIGEWLNGSGEHGMEAGPAGHIGGSPNPSISKQITDFATQYHVDPFLVHAVAQRESGERETDASGKTITSSAGAMGVMQLMPATARALGVDARDAEQNIIGGITELAQLLDKYKDTTKALEAYNWGSGKLDRALASGAAIPKDVRDYASGIEERAKQLTINGGINIQMGGTNLTHKEVAQAVTDGVSAAMDRQTQNSLSEVAGVY